MNNEQRLQQMIKAAHEYIQSDSVAAGNEVLAFGDFINGAKWADSHPAWIPVEERLPERMNEKSRFSETVLVYNKDGYKDTAYYDFEEKIWRWLPSVTHWMPIVPPRKEEDNE